VRRVVDTLFDDPTLWAAEKAPAETPHEGEAGDAARAALYDDLALWAAHKAARRARDPMAAAFNPAAAALAGQAVEPGSTGQPVAQADAMAAMATAGEPVAAPAVGPSDTDTPAADPDTAEVDTAVLAAVEADAERMAAAAAEAEHLVLQVCPDIPRDGANMTVMTSSWRCVNDTLPPS
jgi:hypothetical protein